METDLQSLHPDTGWKEKNPHGWGVRIGRLMQRLMAKPTPARRGTRESVSCDKQAMGYVQQSIDLAISANPAIGKALHDVLLVFNRGTAQECRVKADHIVVGRFKTYVISSKYQCGRVHAIARDPEWTVYQGNVSSRMHNALAQAKSTARALSSQIHLRCELFPIAAIHGEDTLLAANPSNVVLSQDLMDRIAAYEAHASQFGCVALNVERLFAFLSSKVSIDPAETEPDNDQAHLADSATPQFQIGLTT
jgi:hypothetical protein